MEMGKAAGGGCTGGVPVETGLFGKLEYRPKSITMAAVAKAAGVSQGAVSSLLNDRHYGIRVSPETRNRVIRVCRELGYVPNDLRAVVRMYPETGDFCILRSRAGKDARSFAAFVARVTEAVSRATDARSGSVTLGAYDPAIDYVRHPEELPRPVRVGTATKLLLVGKLNPSLLEALRRLELAAVCLGPTGGNAEAGNVTTVTPDFAGAAKMAIRYLHSLGHRRIAVVSGRSDSSDPRMPGMNAGVALGFREVGIGAAEQCIAYGDLTFSSGANAVDSLMERRPRPSAVFCIEDAAAVGVLSRAHERGLRVPRDLSVIGCSDDSFAATLSPKLTAVNLPIEEMAKRGVEEAENLIGEDEPKRWHRVVLPVSLVERGSCAGPGHSSRGAKGRP